MAKFKTGDIARFVKVPGCNYEIGNGTEHIGHRVTITGDYRLDILGYGRYEVRCECGIIGTPLEETLEPIQKRPELGSVDELSKILGGWRPNQVRESV